MLNAQPARPFVVALESTYMPRRGVDVADTTGHSAFWKRDLELALDTGVRSFRYPLRWHRIEPRPGHFDWSTADEALGHLREHGAHVMVDLVHHTSHPDWLEEGFRDRRFGPAYLRYAEAVATRYPWLPAYTLFNEPLATLFLAGHEALWPPYDSGIAGFVRLLTSVLPALSAASRCWSELLPHADHVWVDTCEHHAGSPGAPQQHADLANDRRHAVLDIALHHDLRTERPFLRKLVEAGAEPLLALEPVRVDVLGLDYYCHSEWWYDDEGAHVPSPQPQGLAVLAQQYGERYGLPMLVSETNIRGFPTDRASWLRYTLEQYELAVARGVPLQGYCWFPFADSRDWDSLLARPGGRIDPVGVLSVGDDDRERTVFTQVWEAAARGVPVSSLPAFRFQSPCSEQLAGFLPHMADWPWQEPSPGDVIPPLRLG